MDKDAKETIRRLESELERMNGVVAGMEADAELGRLVRQMPIGKALFLVSAGWFVDEAQTVSFYKGRFDTPEAALKAALEVDEP